MKYLLLLLFQFFSGVLFSQRFFNGVVMSRTDNSPVMYATIGISHKSTGCIADSTGKYSLLIPQSVTEMDTIVITAIGYSTHYISLNKLKDSSVVYLDEKIKELSPVVVRSVSKTIELGRIPSHGPSFSMGWGNDGQGGEAGNEFTMPFENYQLVKVFAKISTTYDTCWFRLHLRKMENGLPGEELLQENIIISTTVKEGAIEFDLSRLACNISENNIFVGIELLRHSLLGSQSGKKKNYMVYMGNEPAKFRSFHKWYSNTEWELGKGHSFSMKLVVKY